MEGWVGLLSCNYVCVCQCITLSNKQCIWLIYIRSRVVWLWHTVVVVDLPTREGWKAELAYCHVIMCVCKCIRLSSKQCIWIAYIRSRVVWLRQLQAPWLLSLLRLLLIRPISQQQQPQSQPQHGLTMLLSQVNMSCLCQLSVISCCFNSTTIIIVVISIVTIISIFVTSYKLSVSCCFYAIEGDYWKALCLNLTFLFCRWIISLLANRIYTVYRPVSWTQREYVEL